VSVPVFDNAGQTATGANRAEQEISTPPAHTATVNADNPWPGLLAFREVDQEYFQGRRSETEDLFRLVMRERLTVLFGVSGLGKSSLLQAGLFPLLRRESVLPIYLRLDFSSPNANLVAHVKGAIEMQAKLSGVEAPATDPKETLWEYFHRQENDFWTRRNRPAVPLLVFDQFEELFTLGRLDPHRMQSTDTLLEQLADLVEGRTPAALKKWLDEHPDDVRKYSFSHHHYKVLLSIRADFMPELEALRERMPSVALNRLRLQRMNGEAALQVVAQAKQLIDPPVAEKVVRDVAAGRDGAPLRSLEVEPALLSVVCRELNNKRQSVHEPKITASLLEGSHDQILSDFYELTVGDLPPAVRSFIEEHLLTVSGFRDSVALENVLSVPGISSDSINKLVERRLLRREDRGGGQRLELTHDLLTGVIRASRDRRRQKEEAEHARAVLLAEQERETQSLKRQREEEERDRAKRDLKRTRRWAVIFSLLTIVAILALIAATYSLKKAQTERQMAEKQERAAMMARAYADHQRQIAEDAVNRIQQSLLIRQAALSGDQEKLNELLSKLGQNDKIQFSATATDLRYRNPAGQEVYKFELFPRPETLPSGKDAVAFVTYLANHHTFQNTLLTAAPSRDFRATYIGWGCLSRIVALTEYADPTKSATVTIFNMCAALEGDWHHGP
jgi:hypothetical protein